MGSVGQNRRMSANSTVLLVDGDEELLRIYGGQLSQLQGSPRVLTAATGAKAMALLESEACGLLVMDVELPRMSGLQILAVVRKRHPETRTILLTARLDEQVRSRAYGMGVDLFLEKPRDEKELRFLMDCVESLMGQGGEGGFRGVQSKSLVDIIQFECLSANTAVVRIVNGAAEGRIWIVQGEVHDAEAPGCHAEEAFKRILGWKGGGFEILPGDAARPRVIALSYQGLLLESAQAADEAQGEGEETGKTNRLSELGRVPGVDFLLLLPEKGERAQWGVANPEAMAQWIETAAGYMDKLGEIWDWGRFEGLSGRATQENVNLLEVPGGRLVVGTKAGLSRGEVAEAVEHVRERWAS